MSSPSSSSSTRKFLPSPDREPYYLHWTSSDKEFLSTCKIRSLVLEKGVVKERFDLLSTPATGVYV